MSNSTKEIEQYLEQQDKSMQALQMQAQNAQVQQGQTEMYLQEQERSMVREQLDLSDDLIKINYLLRGFIYDAKKGDWIKPESQEMVVLTEYGVHLVMNTIQWYINKNTLLSNYDEETILTKMEDFATALADSVFMEYEKVFQYPSMDDCQKVLEKRIANKIESKEYSLKLMGMVVNKEEIRKTILNEMQGRIQEELEKIKEQIIKNKLKRFELLIRTVQDTVHSTYLRAWKGQERGTLRKHTHVSETIGGNMPPNSRGGSPLSWFTGRN